MKFYLVILLSICVANAQEETEMEETTTELCSNNTVEICEAFNVSETSVEPELAEGATKAPAVSTKPSKTPKTSTRRLTVGQNTTTQQQPHAECTCDTTRGGCEVNCCCDVDCSADQRAVFTRCLRVPQIVDSDHCFPSQLLYRNNTDFQAIQTDPGILCVLHQNTLSSTDYVSVSVIRTVTALKRKLGWRKYYSWPSVPPVLPVFDVDTSYDNESPVWIIDNTSVTYLALPTNIGASSLCQDFLVPKYLQDVETSCIYFLRNKMECYSLTNTKFSVISSPRNFNFTHPQECTEDVCLPVSYYVCSTNCSEGKLPQPEFNKSSNECQNVLLSIEYKIYHNGTQGIVEVKVVSHFANLSVHDNQMFRKHSKVSYEWAVTSEFPVFERSGRPGYELNKPIISGRQVIKSFEYNFTKEHWISVGVSGISGYCQKRYNLLFGENVKSKCLFNVSGACSSVQQRIWQQMLGPVANLTDSVISSFGEPRTDDKDAWVPLLASELPPPPALLTAVDILLVYSLVGHVSSPQAKIIAVYLHYLPATYTCQHNLSSTTVMLDTSVRFIDKTAPAITKFAQPPVYEIKLPRDFFYPFLSVGSKNFNFTNWVFLVVTILLCVI